MSWSTVFKYQILVFINQHQLEEASILATNAFPPGILQMAFKYLAFSSGDIWLNPLAICSGV